MSSSDGESYKDMLERERALYEERVKRREAEHARLHPPRPKDTKRRRFNTPLNLGKNARKTVDYVPPRDFDT